MNEEKIATEGFPIDFELEIIAEKRIHNGTKYDYGTTTK